MALTITRADAARAAQSAAGKVGTSRRLGRATPEMVSGLTEAKTILAIVDILAEAPPMTAAAKGRILALVDSAPVLR